MEIQRELKGAGLMQQPLEYWFGSCWSKGDINGSAEWFELAAEL